MAYIGAGKLDQPLDVLELQETGTGTWEWVVLRRAWAQVEQTNESNLFSKVGVGARDAALVIRRQPLTLHNALRWKGQHLFLTAITENGRNHLSVSAALVEPVLCTATRTEDTVGENARPVRGETMRLTFSGVLTEKYARYEREETHAENETSYVLVTSKPIALKAGDLVTVQEGSAKGRYHVTVCHVLDAYKNEYEIMFSGDV